MRYGQPWEHVLRGPHVDDDVPLTVVLVQLAHQMRKRRLIVRADWLPRLENEEADALTNFDYRHSDSAKRVEVDLAKLEFGVLNELFSCGEEYMGQLEAERAERAKGKPDRKLRPEERPKVTQPWPWSQNSFFQRQQTDKFTTVGGLLCCVEPFVPVRETQK